MHLYTPLCDDIYKVFMNRICPQIGCRDLTNSGMTRYQLRARRVLSHNGMRGASPSPSSRLLTTGLVGAVVDPACRQLARCMDLDSGLPQRDIITYLYLSRKQSAAERSGPHGRRRRSRRRRRRHRRCGDHGGGAHTCSARCFVIFARRGVPSVACGPAVSPACSTFASAAVRPGVRSPGRSNYTVI